MNESSPFGLKGEREMKMNKAEEINKALEYIRKRRARLSSKEARPGELAEIELEEEFDNGVKKR